MRVSFEVSRDTRNDTQTTPMGVTNDTRSDLRNDT